MASDPGRDKGAVWKAHHLFRDPIDVPWNLDSVPC